jgi:hypothetical protein
MLVILTVASYLQLWRRNKKQSFNIRETLYTSYKNAYAMTQEIKIILTLKRKNMIPNIKSSEGIETVSWKKKSYTCPESIMFSVLQETQYVYPFKSSVREIVSNCLDSVTERNNSRKIINGELLAQICTLLWRNRVFWVRL